ncbi:hypothetical protein FKM82_019661 [Ascaphus truei]
MAPMPPVATTYASSGPRIPTHNRYDGHPLACRGFLNQCEVQFEMSPSLFPTGRAKVAYIYALLTGDAFTWASPLWERKSELTQDYSLFRREFQFVFDTPTWREIAAFSLFSYFTGPKICCQIRH